MKKRVAVIGAANPLGLAISAGLAAAGYPVLMTDGVEPHLSPLLVSIMQLARIKIRMPHADVRLVVSEREASWEADIVFPVVPRETLTALSRRIEDVVTGKIVVCLSGRRGEVHDDPGKSDIPGAAREMASLFPHSKIVSATVTTVPGCFGEPGRVGEVSHVMVSGDDQEALSNVVDLIRDAGFVTLKDGAPARH